MPIHSLMFIASFIFFAISCGGEHQPLPDDSIEKQDRPPAEEQQQGDGEEEGHQHSADPVTYIDEIQPLIKQRCVLCHNEESDLSNWMNYEVAFESREEIYQRVVVEESMPLDNATNMTQEEREKMATWIEEGVIYSVENPHPEAGATDKLESEFQ